ncbi:tetratricopeptide repeat protein [Oceanobacillus halophilus]|uniref:Uncharacterized protein n=1 Tax=Oceanobacillus halophilus TaxID=930130 RepID=A0A495A8L6_9BACI|nr:hypothetical protein [Oceanobacillus halophilus]RKQ35685.1 hypothetical protein D8M06_05305 [Oceanobacillus halophilus]
MNKNQFQAKANKKQLTLTPVKLVLYKQTKIIESTDPHANFYYIIYYKNNFINGVKANKIRLHSYIHQAFKNGIHFDGTHPLVNQLIQSEQSFHFIKFNQLIKTLPKSYTKKEIAFVFLFFNSFTKPGSSKNLFKNTFYDFRRNGQDFSAYQALKYYSNYNPKDKFVFDMIHNIEFQRYEKQYKELETILENDPNYAELICFENRNNKDTAERLFSLYKDQNRVFDEIAVRIDLLKHSFTEENYQNLETLLNELPFDVQIGILTNLIKADHAEIVEKKLLSLLLESGLSNNVTEFLLTSKFEPTPEQLPIIIKQIEQTEDEVLIANFKQANKRLLALSGQNSKTLERLVKPFVSAALDTFELTDIINWFQPFRDAHLHLPIEKKVIKMKQLANDPDRQFALGEMYLDFHQWEKSIDCFKWEMELHPEDPKPVNYLSKIYNEIGNKDEAKAYQQLMVQMNK